MGLEAPAIVQGFSGGNLGAVAWQLARNSGSLIGPHWTPPAIAAKNANLHDPNCLHSVGDPVGSGLVVSLARPGANLTGFSNIAVGLAPKEIELISEFAPQACVIFLLVNPNSPTAEPLIRGAEEAVR